MKSADSYLTPQFDSVINSSQETLAQYENEKNLGRQSWQMKMEASQEESKNQLMETGDFGGVPKTQFIDLNDDDVIYKGKKAFSPVISASHTGGANQAASSQ